MYQFRSYDIDGKLYDVTEKDFGDAAGFRTDAKARVWARFLLTTNPHLSRVEVFSLGLSWIPGSGGMGWDRDDLHPVMCRGKAYQATR